MYKMAASRCFMSSFRVSRVLFLNFTLPFVAISAAHAAPVTLQNPSFEDTSGQFAYNEYTFGTPSGWTLYDPDNVVGDPDVYVGTLFPNGSDFFNTTAPDGDRVLLLFNSAQRGAGEYGFEQLTGEVLMTNTRYELSVDIGDIDSGTDVAGVVYNLEGFPGYRLQLLAGGQLVAEDHNTQAASLIEGEFSRVTLSVDIGASHALEGDAISLRLTSLNTIPENDVALGSPALEVDFDNVTLDATPLPEDVGIVNPSFEDPTGLTPYFEFGFGVPQGWSDYAENNVTMYSGVYQGHMLAAGNNFITNGATDGDYVAIAFNDVQKGGGAYGYQQLLGEALQLNTRYTLSVDVANPATGQSGSGQTMNLDEFPGYRIQLLAGDSVLGQDDNSMAIGEGGMLTTSVSVDIGATHPEEGAPLTIRLINLNQIPAGYTAETAPDLVVDFDNVRLQRQFLGQ